MYANEINFGSLERYAPGSLSFEMKPGRSNDISTLNISSLKDIDSSGDPVAVHLSISGPNSVSLPNFTGLGGGSITLENVNTAVLSGYNGNVVINNRVEHFTSNSLVDLSGSMAHLVTLNIDGILDPKTTTDKSGPAIYLHGLEDLETVTLGGVFSSIDLYDLQDLETVTITADVNNGDIVIDNCSDLEVLSLTGSKATGVTVRNCNDLEDLTIDTVMQRSLATGATLEGSINVNDNSKLRSLSISSTDISRLSITNNIQLETINGTGMNSIGEYEAGNVVSIFGNNFVCDVAQDQTNESGCTNCGPLQPNDLGQFFSSSGMSTLKTYLTVVYDNPNSQSEVYWDKVISSTNANGAETVGVVTVQGDVTVILQEVPATPGEFAVIKTRVHWL